MTREEAITKIKWEMAGQIIDKDVRNALETLIPELCESEDERIRKEIIDFIQWAEDRGMTRHDYHQAKRPSEWIAYLEKQREPSTDYFSTSHIETFSDGTTVRHTIGYLEKGKEQRQNPLIRILEDKKAITEDIRNGIPTKTIEKERNVKFATPVDVNHTEWSEEDKSILEALIYDIERLPVQGVLTHRPCDSYIKFLKALRPSWKPSEEAMKALRECGECKRCIKELYEDIQKRYGTC